MMSSIKSCVFYAITAGGSQEQVFYEDEHVVV